MKEVKEEEKISVRKRLDSKNNKKVTFKIPKFEFSFIKTISKKQIIGTLSVVSVFLAIICIFNYDKFGLVLNKYITDEEIVKIDLISSNNKIYEYENEVLVANLDGIYTYNKYGKQTWKLELQGAIDDYITTNGNFIQVINQDKSLVYIFKNKYETARIKIEGEILSGYINENGDSVIEYKSTGNKAVLAVYNSKGKLQYNVKLSNNIIGKYVLSNDARYLAYIDVNIKGISLATGVKLIELKNGNNDSVIKEIYLGDKSIVYDLSFKENNKLVYKLDEQIVIQRVDSDDKKTSTIGNESLVNIDIDQEKYAYVMFEDGNYYLGVRNIGGKESKNVELREMPKHFIYENGNIFVCYQKNVEVYNSLKMKIKEYDSSMAITEPIVFDNGRSLAFLISNKLIMFSI